MAGNLRAATSHAGEGQASLTQTEQLWLEKNRPRLVVAVEKGYPPFVFLDTKGQPTGLAHEYLLAVENRLGVRFKRAEFASLSDILAKARNGEVHVVNAVTETPLRSKALSFTKPFLSVPNVILVRKERTETLEEQDLAGLKVSLVENYAVTERLGASGIDFEPDPVQDDLGALLNVSFGRSDAAVIDLATASYLISQKGITNLRVAGEASSGIDLAMAVPHSDALLRDILQKGLDAIPADERVNIRERWIHASKESIVNGRFVLWMAAGLFALLAVMTAVLAWNRTLRRLVATRTADLAREKEALQLSEQYHRSILETAMDGIWLLNGDGRLLEVNGVYCRMSGYSEQELLRMGVTDLEVLESAGETEDHLGEILAKGQDSFESRHRRKDETVYDVEIRIQRLCPEAGTMVAFLRDITERKRIEDELRMTRVSVEAASDAIFWITPGGRFVDVNKAACRSLGYSREELLRLGVSDVDPHCSDADCRQQFHELRQVRAMLFETEHRKKDGRILSVEVSANYVRLGDEERNCAFVRDISDRKEAEEKRLLLEQQLLQAQKLESIGRLAGGVAHDFNNMLGVIIGHADMGMIWQHPEAKVCHDLREIKMAAERSAQLTRQLLAFARKQMVEPKVLDLNDSVHHMLKMLQRLIGEDIRLVWDPAPQLWQVRIDPSQVDQILANLCVNARDAIGGSGTITLRTGNRSIDSGAGNPDASPGEYVCLTIGDDGAGMDAETLSHLFEPFFTTKETGKGTGLGLATVYGSVRQNNGFIDVDSEPGRGTTFHLYFPRHLPREVQAAAEPAAAPPPRGEETILLVEDEGGILKIAAEMLEIQGYRVLPAATPAEAQRLAREHDGSIELMITDVIMPERNGNDLSNELCALRPGMKRLFMSGYTAEIIARHGVVAEGIQFLQKPFTLPVLATKVREVLDAERPRQAW